MFENWKDQNPLQRTRRNHALEHATLTVLRQKGVRGPLAGISGPTGFWIYGMIDPSILQISVEEALQRLRNGEKQLAINPNCGTNYVIPGVLSGLAVWLLMLIPGKDDCKYKLEHLPWIIFVITLISVLARPLGPTVQRKVSTNANVGRMKVSSIMIYTGRGRWFQHVVTRH
ncbi:MAG: DUF6391 domain-containing protein [Anaerolineaceae bacterium]|nr:DUF6391 domain-containing protein [Anaerolineaceae bacterium]